MEPFVDLARRRRSVHSFNAKPVEFEKVVELLRAGGYAPSVGDLQMWSYVIITDDDVKRSIVDNCPQQEWMINSAVLIVVTSDIGKTYDFYGDYADRWCSMSIAANVQNMMLCATDIGLGSCWVSSFDSEVVRDILKIPDGFRPEVVLAVGYSDEIPEDKALRPLDQCTFFNAYGAKLESMHSFLRDWGDHFREKGRALKKDVDRVAEESGVKEKIQTQSESFRDKLKDFLPKKKK